MTQLIFNRRALPAAARVSHWLAPDGWRYRRMHWPQEKTGAARGSLLFAGGRGDFIEKYLEAQHHWHEAGWDVTAFDWRSQGGSRGTIEGGHLDSLDPLVDDLEALIADWKAATPAPHVVVGHSMGGHVLLRTLAERRPELAAAVLIAPMVMINTAPLPVWAAAATAQSMAGLGWGRVPAWRDGADPAPPGSSRQNFLTRCPERYADEQYWWNREPGFSLGPPSWGWLHAAYRSCAELTDARLAGIAVPVLFIATETDRLVSAEAIRRAHKAIPETNLLMFPDAGHEILREQDPVRLQALGRIDGFLDRHAAR
ncbi:MAG TPA: alpha/beta hydrolase [Allosphingosinicella sp.]|nr:alpha/beta hydrolase [Allosphingosinicella sp.]